MMDISLRVGENQGIMQDKSQSIDKLLLQKGLITPAQLTEALQYQCRLPNGQEMSLPEVLVAMEYVTEAAMREALGETPPAEDVLVQMLVKEGLIEEKHLADALRQRGENDDSKRLGTVLLELGYTTREVIETALKHYYLKHHQTAEMPSFEAGSLPAGFQQQRPQTGALAAPEEEHIPLGQRLIRKGYISPEELQHALDYQQRLPRILHKPIGEILILLGYLDQLQLDTVLNEKPPVKQLSLGEVLVRTGIIQQWQLSHAMSLKDQPEHASKKLGNLLVELGYARRPEMEAALKDFYARQQR